MMTIGQRRTEVTAKHKWMYNAVQTCGEAWPPSWPAARSSQPWSRMSISKRITAASRTMPKTTWTHL